MKVISAPDVYTPEIGDVTVFLAGGIQNTINWQLLVIQQLQIILPPEPRIVIFNPRREMYPHGDTAAVTQQIKWEFDMINAADIFSIYFASGLSDQPICMLEYGKQLVVRSQNNDMERLVVSVHPEYKRREDVIIQTALHNPEIVINNSLAAHVNYITRAITKEVLRKLETKG